MTLFSDLHQSQWFPIIAITLAIWIFISAETIIMYEMKVHGQETPYNKTYLDQWIKDHGCNCTHLAMEQAARILDNQTK